MSDYILKCLPTKWECSIGSFNVFEDGNCPKHPETGGCLFMKLGDNENVCIIGLLNEMRTKMETMEEMLIKCYHAPGMPGCIESWEEIKHIVEK